MARGAFPPAAPSVAQYGGDALTIKRGAGEGGVDQLVADFRGALVGDRQRRRAARNGRAAPRGNRRSRGSGRGRWGRRCRLRRCPRLRRRRAVRAATKRPFLNVPRRWLLARREGAGGAALLVEAVEPVLAVDAGEVGVADRWRHGRSAAALRPAQASGVVSGSASSSWRHRRASSGSGLASSASNASRPPCADDVVGVLAGGQLDEAQRPVGAEQGQGARARRGSRPSCPALSPSKHRIGDGIEPPHPLELRFGERGAVGRDDLGDAGAVERDHVHIALDHDQPLGGAAGGAGAVEVVERPALVEERRVGGVEIFGLAVAEDPAAERR